jgi:hypothetical protein
MFLRREYRNRAVGLVAAYAVLIAGIVVSGALDPAPANSAMRATEAAMGGEKTRQGDCSFALECRPDSVC